MSSSSDVSAAPLAGPRHASWVAPLAVAVIWGVNVPVMKAVLVEVHPFAFNAMRLTLSAIALGVADRLERRGRPRVAPAPWRVIVPLSLLISLLYQVLFIEGIAHTSASHTGFLIASGPLWTALIARMAGVERPDGRAWFGLAVAFVGTSLVAAATGGGEASLLGNGLVLVAMLVWSLGAVLSRPLLENTSATRLAYLCTLIALPGHWLLALPHLEPLAEGTLPAATYVAVIYSGVLSTGVAYALWNVSLRRLGPARTSAYTNLVPLVALALAWAALGERPSAMQLVGGGLVLAGISSWRAVRRVA